MSSFVRSRDVVGGRIKAVCSRCGRKAYLEVAPGSRRRIFRCTCGKSAYYEINYRRERREVTYGPARAILKNAEEKKVRLCDTSLHGVSFYISKEHAMSMNRGQELSIKFRSGGSSMMQRKIKIKNITKTRIGAQFIKAGISL